MADQPATRSTSSAPAAAAPGAAESAPETLIVTSALPYANGPIHFGHVVGAYLPADVFVRFRRMCGDRVHFVCGTDEHGVAITLRAEQSGQPYEEYVDRWHAEIRRTLEDVGIRFDIFSGTGHHRNPHHRPLAQQFFTDLHRNGYLSERVEEQFYSESLRRFLPDRYVEGTCYECGYPQARGDECPRCGSWLDAKRLQNPRSILDGKPPVLKESKHWYLDLPRLKEEWLQGWFEGKRERWKVNVRAFVEHALADLRERPITRDLPWGVPVPLPGTEGKVLYVWFEAPIGYPSISRQYFAERGQPEEWERLWHDPATKLYHFIGKDNITFHVVVFPAMLHGTKRGWIVPENVPANEFFNLEGRKFNTSKGWFIPEDSVRGRFSTDTLRYTLVTMMPETADSDWSWREFQARVNGDLADNLGNFVARTLRFVERYLDGTIPEAGTLQEADRRVLDAGRGAASDMRASLDQFAFRKACQRLMAFSSECNRYFDEAQPWATRKTDPARCRTTMRVCTELVRTLAVLAAPVLPDTSRAVLAALGCEAEPAWHHAGGERLRTGPLPVAPLPVLFPKVDDAFVDGELSKLAAMAAAADAAAPSADSALPSRPARPQHAMDTPTPEPTSSSTPPSTPSGSAASGPSPAPGGAEALAAEIQYEQFAAVDLRAGTIVEAQRHPKADRLLVLRVDIGLDVRTVVAGIAGAYAPEELLGRRVVVVANLAPRALRGITSQGMLLAADGADGKPRLLAPTGDPANGTRIK